MALISDEVRQQMRSRFDERLEATVEMELYIKPGSSRLILPSGIGCPTCQDAQSLAEAVAEAGGDRIVLRVIDVSSEPDTNVESVPTLRLGVPGHAARIAYQGLPAGFEFATVVDAVERLSRIGAELGQESIDLLLRATEPVEVMVFTTPT